MVIHVLFIGIFFYNDVIVFRVIQSFNGGIINGFIIGFFDVLNNISVVNVPCELTANVEKF